MREKDYLKQRYAAMLSSAGMILILAGLVMIMPLAAILADPAEVIHMPAFIIPACSLCLLGGALWRWLRPLSALTLSIREGGVVVVVGWGMVIVFSAWPFMTVSGLTFSAAVFESMSGWTTTGLSVVDLPKAGSMILLWRSIIQLAGGAGLAILMMSAIVGPVGVGISSAEGRGDQLVPNVRRSARLVLTIYLGYAAAGTIAYRLAGMSFFDAVNHAFAAVSTGGFSTYTDSIGHWDSVVIEAVTLPLMILGNLSFITAWFLIRGRIQPVLRNGEVRLMAVLTPLAAAALFLFTSRLLYPQLEKSLRVALFEAVSAFTTTGFSTVGYENWNGFGALMLTGLMLIGGGTCSTAGGIKQFRIYLVWKFLVWEIRRQLLPRCAVMVRPFWEGDRQVFVEDARIGQAAVFIFLYLSTYAIGVLLLCACGYSLRESLFEFASAIGTVGLSVGVSASQMPMIAMWAEILAMFLGRLEFVVVIVSLLTLVGDGGRALAVTMNGINGNGSKKRF